MSERVFIIAEAGVNHNGSLDLAKQLIDCAAEAGADAVKFQTFKATEIAQHSAPKAQYQSRTTDAAESQLDMLRKLELSANHHATLIAHAKQRDIQFLSTPFDLPSLRLLTDQFGLKTLKIPSGEITNAPLVLECARRAKSIILSTGMATLAEVEWTLGVIEYGFTHPTGTPAHDEIVGYRNPAASKGRVVLLHCTTEYPAPFSEVNLRAMDTLAAAFGLPVGYSDHTPGTHISVAAVACGARVIEKHFTVDRSLPGPDHRASLEPGELRQMVSAIRDVESAMGDGLKRPGAAELKNRAIARKSLIAARPTRAGDTFTADNLTCKRPGTGRPATDFWRVLGTRALRDYAEDEPIDA